MPPFLCKNGSVIPVVVLFGLMLCVTSPLIWHSDNLTFCHALYSNDAPSPHWVYPSYLLSYPLCLAAKAIPSLNVYLLYLYGLLLGSATAVLRVSRAQGNGITSTIGQAGLLFACHIIFFIPQCIHYPWISFLAAGCGCMLIFNSLYRERLSKGDLVLGGVLFLGGIILRHDSCLGCIPFIGAASLFLIKPASGFQRWMNLHRSRLIVPALCLGSIIFAALFQHYPAQNTYNGGNLIDMHMSRMGFYDYGDRSGIDKTQEYATLGIDQASIHLLQSYLFDDPDVQTPEWWENAGRIRAEHNPRAAVFKKDTVFYTIKCLKDWKYLFLTIVLLALWSTFNRRGVGKAYPMAMLACFALGIFLCCIRLRCHETPVMSLTYFYLPMLLVGYKYNLPKSGEEIVKKSTLFTAAFAAMYIMMLLEGSIDVCYLGVPLFLAITYPAAYLAQRKTRIAPLLISGLLTLLFFAIFLAKYQSHIRLFGGFRQTYGKYTAEHSDLVKYATEHRDLLFLCGFDSYRALAYPDHTLLNPRKPYLTNVIECGNWQTMLPHRQLQREKLGIRNEALSVLDERIRFVLHRKNQFPSLLCYLREHYGILAEFEEEHSLGAEYAVFRAKIRHPQ